MCSLLHRSPPPNWLPTLGLRIFIVLHVCVLANWIQQSIVVLQQCLLYRYTYSVHHNNEREITMPVIKTSRRRSWFSVLGAILCLLAFAAPASAKSGQILPPTAQLKGYSLVEAAAATAFFNSGSRAEDELPKGFPFQILYLPDGAETNTFRVKPGTFLYVPVVWDDTLANVSDPEAVQDHYVNQEKLGAEYLNIVVDGKRTTLDPEYAVGVETPGLRPYKYTTVAAFVSPLSPGTHTVTIEGRLTGKLLENAFPDGVLEYVINYTVIVG